MSPPAHVGRLPAMASTHQRQPPPLQMLPVSTAEFRALAEGQERGTPCPPPPMGEGRDLGWRVEHRQVIQDADPAGAEPPTPLEQLQWASFPFSPSTSPLTHTCIGLDTV